VSRRIVIEEPCEHKDMYSDDGRLIDGMKPHPLGVAVGYSRGGGKTYERWCEGATVLTEPSEEMVERAARGAFLARYPDGNWEKAGKNARRNLYYVVSRAALSAALFSSDSVAGEET